MAKAKTDTATDIAVATGGRQISAEMSALMDKYKGGGAGLEEVRSKDLIIPFIRILQALSPAVKKREPTYIEGAEEGMFINTATDQLWDGDKGFRVIPCMYMPSFTEWEPGAQGNLVAVHGKKEPIGTVRDKVRLTLGDNDITEATDFYVLQETEEGGPWEKAIISLSKTQFKKGRKWLTSITNERPLDENGVRQRDNLWYRSWHAKMVPESNDQGSWCGWKFREEEIVKKIDPTMELWGDSVQFYEQVISGAVSAAPNEEREVSASEQAEDAI